MSGNLGSVPLSVPSPVPPPVPPPGLSLVLLPGPQQNPQIYIKEISINKSPIFIETTNRARKWLVDI